MFVRLSCLCSIACWCVNCRLKLVCIDFFSCSIYQQCIWHNVWIFVSWTSVTVRRSCPVSHDNMV